MKTFFLYLLLGPCSINNNNNNNNNNNINKNNNSNSNNDNDYDNDNDDEKIAHFTIRCFSVGPCINNY